MRSTRVTALQDIMAHLFAPIDSSIRIVAVCGMAGSGKSTIAKTIAKHIDKEKRLAASFFFSREYEERKRLAAVPATLALQLSAYSFKFCQLLIEALESDGTQLDQAESHLQFQKLVVDLLVKLPASTTPIVIILDALDECDDRGARLLKWLSVCIEQIPPHIRFLITGRPERSILSHLVESKPLHHLSFVLKLEDVDHNVVNHDILQYLKQSLIGQTWDVPHEWAVTSVDAVS